MEVVYSGSSVKNNNLEILGKPIRLSDFVVIGVNESSPLIMQREYNIIKDRVDNPRKNSYTSELASDDNKSIKKAGEEYTELIRELSKEKYDKKRITSEFADLLYVLQVNLAKKDIEFKEITKEIYQRMKRD